MRFGLDRMRRLMTTLGQPAASASTSIHVVGTNGKSSTVADDRRDPRSATACAPAPTCRRTSSRSPSACASTAATSSAERFGAAVQRAAHAAALVDRTLGRRRPRDPVRGADRRRAYSELAARDVEVAVVEAGLGGRCDATNVLPVERSGADERRPRAHALARADDARHRRGEARRRAPEGGTLVIGADLHAGRTRRRRGGPSRSAAARRCVRGAAIDARASRSARAGASSGATSRSPAPRPRRSCGAARSPTPSRAAAPAVDGPGAACSSSHEPLVCSTAPTTPRDGGAGGVAAAAVGERRLVRGRLDPRRQGRRRRCCACCCRCATTSSSQGRQPAGAVAGDARLARRAARRRSRDGRGRARSVNDALARARELAGRDGVVLVTGSIYLLGRPAAAARRAGLAATL